VTAGIELVSVFAAGPGGGNPAPVVIDAMGLSDAQMRDIAKTYGHEAFSFCRRRITRAISRSASSYPITKWRCAAMPRSVRSGC